MIRPATGDRLPARRRVRTSPPGRVVRAATRVGPSGTFAAVLILGLLVITAASSLFAGLYVAVIDDDSVALLDEPALHLAMDVRSPWLDTAVTVFTEARASTPCRSWASRSSSPSRSVGASGCRSCSGSPRAPDPCS
ncbi:hypothetical protein [Clavibacter michiganensis]|uniref:hypothetical protein n=1 Tax=Clavibacter michiganensis TaxID=28447 RepID=UPI001FB30717|nr:hypothetical protein [Clavibacter michiganensis]